MADKSVVEQWEYNHNQKGTTVRYLSRLNPDQLYEKIQGLIDHNLGALENQLLYLSTKPMTQRMMRISSDFLPCYTHEVAKWLYRRTDIIDKCEKGFRKAGEFARHFNIRLSFHPGQFVQLNNQTDRILLNSIEEFEYHVKMAEWMGYGAKPYEHGFEINVHGGGRVNGLDGLEYVIDHRLSPSARNLISLENDEFSYCIDDLLRFKGKCAILLDVHHYWINKEKYIQPNDPRILQIIESWQGVRPEVHFAVTHEELLVDHDPNVLPNIDQLLENGYKKSKLRAHSYSAWNNAAIDYILEFSNNFDICFEGKSKNLASDQIYARGLTKGMFD
jgi:UV DNA damage repair endonuclease